MSTLEGTKIYPLKDSWENDVPLPLVGYVSSQEVTCMSCFFVV